MYLTKFKGDFKLSSDTPSDFKAKLKKFIEGNFDDVMNYEVNENTLYINGLLDDTNEVMEKFLQKIFKYIDTEEEVIIKAQGETLTDRYDIILKNDGIYIQTYKLIKSKLEKYY